MSHLGRWEDSSQTRTQGTSSATLLTYLKISWSSTRVAGRCLQNMRSQSRRQASEIGLHSIRLMLVHGSSSSTPPLWCRLRCWRSFSHQRKERQTMPASSRPSCANVEQSLEAWVAIRMPAWRYHSDLMDRVERVDLFLVVPRGPGSLQRRLDPRLTSRCSAFSIPWMIVPTSSSQHRQWRCSAVLWKPSSLGYQPTTTTQLH
mmetsp:Transcript_32096/g.75343  ORF Transcript_32096/g.75343 Transcript_32096/m.75343 type:complete len:203 (+) Transcript_32096:733-1341(+)